jgi:hypothetical protein
MLDWIRLWPEALRLNLAKAGHQRRLHRARHLLGTLPLASFNPAPCQSASDSGRAGVTRCEACHRFDHARRYRFLCPSLVIQGSEARCASDASAVRPHWGRALLLLTLPLLALHLLVTTGFWLNLRHQGLDRLSWLDVALPPRWPALTEHRRIHVRDLALDSLAAGDLRTATVALFTAAHTGNGPASDNIALARLATLGAYHSLADDLHAANLAAHPDETETLAAAWHDDLLLADRPARLARLALARLAAGGDREFWLRAFLQSIRHHNIAAGLLDDPSVKLPHPSLRHALEAMRALERSELAAARAALLAFDQLPPGAAAQAFSALLWLEAGGKHALVPPELVDQKPDLAYALLRRAGRHEEARHALRPALTDPLRRASALGALIIDPDPVLAAEAARLLTRARPPASAEELAAAWLAARRADHPEAHGLAAALAVIGQPVPESLLALDFTTNSRMKLGLAAAVLPMHREILCAVRDANPGALIR